MEDDAPGVPEWVVTYGDMMSLLLTFFIMLVSLSEIVADERYRAILDSLQRYVGYRTGPVAPPGKNFPLNSLLARLEVLGSYSNEELGRGGVKQESLNGNDINVLKKREGKSLLVGQPVFFPPATDELTDPTRVALRSIAKALGGKPNKIEIRGHASADPLPQAGPYHDKRVLTYQRARQVMRFLIDEGIAEHRMRLTALGDVEPLKLATEKDAWMLDRVEVLILDAFAQEFVGPRDGTPASKL